MRIEEAESWWPQRKDVVACAGVCRSWRDMMKEIVKTPEVSGKLTFPISLKQLISKFSQHLTTLTDDGKFLLAARKCRRPTCTDYLISLNADDMSRTSARYVGKLRSNFLGTKFTIYDAQPPHAGAMISKSFHSRRSKSSRIECLSGSFSGMNEEKLVLKNKNPRWHAQLQCWCLNFRGRVTVASVKNFQLVASDEIGSAGQEQEKVILQFGKVGKDLFTMDYSYPISAFQAFAICLSSFDTKIACE
ncbi:tubby-like F-box protein [Musa troglodytarum]|uniref:Tubby-like F-box protein n=1 Tax=Musa troglodytarum TaxID=320322 RepID=A0A9E7FGX9_9LILI|nr:tubby-like F-box protein [Musa troglodytarum]